MKKRNSNTHPYSIKKLSTKTNTKKSSFLNILRHNHLLTKTKDTKHYYFLIHRTLLFFFKFFFFFMIYMGWVDDSWFWKAPSQNFIYIFLLKIKLLIFFFCWAGGRVGGGGQAPTWVCRWFMLIGALRIIVNKLFEESFDTIFMKSRKNYQIITFFFLPINFF